MEVEIQRRKTSDLWVSHVVQPLKVQLPRARRGHRQMTARKHTEKGG